MNRRIASFVLQIMGRNGAGIAPEALLNFRENLAADSLQIASRRSPTQPYVVQGAAAAGAEIGTAIAGMRDVPQRRMP